MKKLMMGLSGLLAVAQVAYYQLPLNTGSTPNVSAAILTFVNEQDSQFKINASVTYESPIFRLWTCKTEVSSFQRIYPHAVAFVSRGNHVFTEVSLERMLKKRHEISLSGFINWDRKSFSIVTQVWQAKTTFHLSNHSTLVTGIETRRDVVEDSFEFTEGVEIPSSNYRFQTFIMSYIGSSKKNAAMYIEGYAGSYYDLSRYTIRIGERFKLSNRLIGFADIEFNKVVERDKMNGFLARVKTDWKLNRKFIFDVMGIHNSYNGLFAIMSSLQYQHRRHMFKTEYRNLRDNSFRYIETSNAWFCSRVLFQYVYQFTK